MLRLPEKKQPTKVISHNQPTSASACTAIAMRYSTYNVSLIKQIKSAWHSFSYRTKLSMQPSCRWLHILGNRFSESCYIIRNTADPEKNAFSHHFPYPSMFASSKLYKWLSQTAYWNRLLDTHLQSWKEVTIRGRNMDCLVIWQIPTLALKKKHLHMLLSKFLEIKWHALCVMRSLVDD